MVGGTGFKFAVILWTSSSVNGLNSDQLALFFGGRSCFLTLVISGFLRSEIEPGEEVTMEMGMSSEQES